MAKVKYLTFNVAVISRGGSSRQSGNQKGKPQNALAAAAYRSGQKLMDEQSREHYDYNPRTGSVHRNDHDALSAAAYRAGAALSSDRAIKTFDFTRKEHVEYSTIFAPENAPDWVYDRQTLWNRVERSEKRKDAQLARDLIAALPRDLTREQQIALIKDFVRENFTSKGMVADVNMHVIEASDGGENPHIHCMLTMRDLKPDGFGNKNRSWNNRGLVEAWRASWEKLSNEYLESAGSDTRVSMKSFKRDGVEREPTKHLGYDAANLEKKGRDSRRGHDNRRTQHKNEVRDILAQRLEWQDGEAALMHLKEDKPEPWSRPPAPDLEMHHNVLRQHLGKKWMLPLGLAAEMVIQVDDMLVKSFDELRDVGWDVFDQLTGWSERERRAELLREEEYERESDRER